MFFGIGRRRGPHAASRPKERVAPLGRFADMDARVELYQRNALECERAARTATDPAIRLAYLDLARQWREMAEHVEFIERRHAAR